MELEPHRSGGQADPGASTLARAPLGSQALLELCGCPSERIDDQAFVEAALRDAAEVAGATVVESVFHRFSPQGISGVVVIAESHLTIHTWPEIGYAAIDVFTCGDPHLLQRIESEVIKRIAPLSHSSRVVERGPGL